MIRRKSWSKSLLALAAVLAVLASFIVPGVPAGAAPSTNLDYIGYSVSTASGGALNTAWARGNLGKVWHEGAWIPYKVVITNVQSNYPGLVNLPDVTISYDFTMSNGSRFVDLVRDIQVGTQDLTNEQAWPDPSSGAPMPLGSIPNVEAAQNSIGEHAWNFGGFQLVNPPNSQVNIPLPPATAPGTVTDDKHGFIVTAAQIKSIVPATSDTIVVYFQQHLSRTFVWSHALESGYAGLPLTANEGGWLYADPIYASDARDGSGFAPGSSGHTTINMTGFGAQTVQLPIPPAPTGLITGYKWQDDNGNGVKDGAEPFLDGWQIHIFGTVEGGLVFSTDVFTSATGGLDGTPGYSFSALTAGTWLIEEHESRAVPPSTGWSETYPVVGGPSVGVGTPFENSGAPLAHVGWSVALTSAAMTQSDMNFGNRSLGNLTITKVVDLGDVVNPSGIDETFTVHISGPGSYSNDVTFTVLDGVLQPPTSVTISNLAPGAYTVTEDNPGPEWAVTGGGNVDVVSGETATSTITNTFVSGSLEVTKVVDFGDLVGSNTIDETFTVTVTGPSYPAGVSHAFVLVDGVLQAPNPWVLDGLLPGSYTIAEADAGVEWTEVVTGSPATVTTGGTASATVTNTFVSGSLEVTKIVVVTGYLFPDNIDETFTVTVTGPSYLGGVSHDFVLVDGVLQAPNPWVLENLLPGDYTISEGANDNWTQLVSGSPAAVEAGQQAAATVTNTIKLPHTTMSPINFSVFETVLGENVLLTITDMNDGDVQCTLAPHG